MTKPLISFVLPNYNSLEWLGEAVTSLLAQTVPNIEIIVIDDFSNDGSWEFLSEWLKDVPRVRLVRNEENMGAGPSRHKGAELANAEIIAICDSDDLYVDERASIILKWFKEHPESELATFPYVSVGYNNEIIQVFDGEAFDHELFKKDGVVTYYSNPSTAMRKKSYLETEGFKRETDKETDDYAFVRNWVKAGKKIDFAPGDHVTLHRNRPESMMSKMRGFRPEWVEARKN